MVYLGRNKTILEGTESEVEDRRTERERDRETERERQRYRERQIRNEREKKPQRHF